MKTTDTKTTIDFSVNNVHMKLIYSNDNGKDKEHTLLVTCDQDSFIREYQASSLSDLFNVTTNWTTSYLRVSELYPIKQFAEYLITNSLYPYWEGKTVFFCKSKRVYAVDVMDCEYKTSGLAYSDYEQGLSVYLVSMDDREISFMAIIDGYIVVTKNDRKALIGLLVEDFSKSFEVKPETKLDILNYVRENWCVL